MTAWPRWATSCSTRTIRAALAHFWSGVFGYPLLEWDEPLKSSSSRRASPRRTSSLRALAEDPEGRGPRLFFHHADSPKSGRNRLHLDVQAVAAGPPTREQLDAEKDRLVALGAHGRAARRPDLGRVAGAVLPAAGSGGERVLPAVTAQSTRGGARAARPARPGSPSTGARARSTCAPARGRRARRDRRSPAGPSATPGGPRGAGACGPPRAACPRSRPRSRRRCARCDR